MFAKHFSRENWFQFQWFNLLIRGSSDYLREVADDVEAVGIVLSHDVEEEGVRVVVEGLVVQEQFSQQTEVLGIRLWERGGVCVCVCVCVCVFGAGGGGGKVVIVREKR